MTTTTSFTPEQPTHPSYYKFVAEYFHGVEVDSTQALELFSNSLKQFRVQLARDPSVVSTDDNFMKSTGRND